MNVHFLLVPADINEPLKIVQGDAYQILHDHLVWFDVFHVLTPVANFDCWVADEGKHIGLQPNARAETVAHYFGAIASDDWIAGDVLVSGPTDGEGNTTSVSNLVVNIVRSLADRPGQEPLVKALTRDESIAALKAQYPNVTVISVPNPPRPEGGEATS